MRLYHKGYGQLGCTIASKVLFGMKYQWLSFLLVWLTACPIYGQVVPKKPVAASDYHLWGTLNADKISDKGKWISYSMRYEDKQDTLFVQRRDAKKKYAFATSGSGTFCGERQFAFLKNGTLQWLDLESGRVEVIADVAKYSFSGNDNYLVTLEGKAEQKKVCIRNSKGQVVERVSGVGDYAPNKDGTAIVCTYTMDGKNGILWVQLGNAIQKKSLVEDPTAKFSHIIWHNGGASFTALKSRNDTEGVLVFYYSFKEGKGFDSSQIKDFPSEYFVENGYASGLTISSDGRKVFFLIRKKPAFSKSFNGIQQWNGNDPVVYSERQLIGDSESNTKIMAWCPEDRKLMSVTGEDKPFGFLNGNQSFAVTYSQEDLPPQYKMNRNVNYYATDLETGQRNLILENQSSDIDAFSFSPQGKYFTYFKENHWWVYDFVAQKHTNLTLGKALQLCNEEDKSWKSVYSVAGWGNHDESLLISDPFDIWKINLEDGNIEKLTKGRETGISYSIVLPPFSASFSTGFSGQVGLAVDTDHDIILSGSRGTATGYFILKPDGQLKTIVFGDFGTKGILKAAKANVYVFQKAGYNDPSELVVSAGSSKSTFKLFQSNTHHYKYAWGKQEIIKYSNAKNSPLQGILYYPADYNPQKKYPMIVHIYEKQSYLYNNYYNPSLQNTTGFNVANLTAQGYFVFFPDIEYELGNPGPSAADCVVSATNEVIRKGIVAPDKIGLIGNSFGGYETNFIIGQTHLFACAISGASVADLRGWYLSIGWNTGQPEIWRFESQQWRMGKSLFEDKQGYERNSPITYADKIETPVLLWTGEQDRQVHYYQSIAFYLALRRLQKKEIMLIYPGEGHSLRNKENQEDLTQKVENWLGYYLKGESPKSWIMEGIE